MSDLEFSLLADRPDAIAVVAEWLFREWGHFQPEKLAPHIASDLEASLNRSSLPFQVVALHKSAPIGIAMVKEHELRSLFPERKNWLGSVVVEPSHRRQGVATASIKQAIAASDALGIRKLHLQTQDLSGGLYVRLGWVPLEEVDVGGVRRLVMVRDSTHAE